MLFRVLDFETTGEKTDGHPAGVIEFGFYDVECGEDGGGAHLDGHKRWGIVKSPIPVDIGARAVHHITDAEIASGIPSETAFLMMSEGQPDVFVAHNAEFEKQFFAPNAIWLCTYKCALRMWPEAPGHSNQVLRYYLGFDAHGWFDVSLAMPPHRALPDAYTTAHILIALLSEAAKRGLTPQDLLKVSSLPPMPHTISFGKHRGMMWQNLPTDYLSWIATKSDMGKDVKWLAKHHLNNILGEVTSG